MHKKLTETLAQRKVTRSPALSRFEAPDFSGSFGRRFETMQYRRSSPDLRRLSGTGLDSVESRVLHASHG